MHPHIEAHTQKIHKHLHRIKQADYLRILMVRTLGNFLIFSSIFMISKTLYKPVREEVRYFVNSKFNKVYIVASTHDESKKEEYMKIQETADAEKGALARLLQVKPVEVIVPEDPFFSVVIPKIGANARVLPNVDASNEKVYLDALKRGVAHVMGTAFPGEGGHIFLFAHSTDYFWNVGNYNAIFYLLGKLEVGDEIDIFYRNQRYVYVVREKTVVDPSEVQYITRKTEKEFLTLQTCWPLGTTLKRLLVFAERVAE